MEHSGPKSCGEGQLVHVARVRGSHRREHSTCSEEDEAEMLVE